MVVDDRGVEHAGVTDFLLRMVAGDYGVSSVRSYALALLRWLRFLECVGVRWDRARREDARDFVLWMRAATPSRPAGRHERGAVNARTGKRYLGATFAPATINHNLAVVSAFYEHHVGQGTGPLINPIPQRVDARGGRVHAHHNPLELMPVGRRGDFRQRVPQSVPRAMPDGMFDELFGSMSSDRDRALLAFYVSCGARPAELLDITGAHLSYGEQLVGVTRKGTRSLQWLPASPDAFVWLLLYQNKLPPELVDADQPVWWTLRRPWRRLEYDALRAVLRRANSSLGTNWTAHDLRHTYAVRMANDPNVPLVSLQVLLGHVHLSTTQRYLQVRLDQVLSHAREHYRRQAEPPADSDVPAPELGYDHSDLQELFGWQQVSGR
jgi:integrase